MPEKKKRPTAHEAIRILFTRDHRGCSYEYFLTITEMYRLGTIVPVEAIPNLIKQFQEAFDSVPKNHQIIVENGLNETIQSLNEQLAEAEAKKEESVQESKTE